MTTWTNTTKAVTAFVNNAISGISTWGDHHFLWSDSRITWGTVTVTAWSNANKASGTASTATVFAGWLFWFTQPGTETSKWTNQIKH